MVKARLVFLTALVVAGLFSVIMVGCGPAQTLLNQIQPCSLLNCDSLGLVDIAGQQNLLIPDWPDYAKDPTCIIPGFCESNIFYPEGGGGGGE